MYIHYVGILFNLNFRTRMKKNILTVTNIWNKYLTVLV